MSQQSIDFVREHAAWAPPVVFALAFGELLAFISLLMPAWAALVAIGALIVRAASISGRCGSPARSAPPAATGCPIGSGSSSNIRSQHIWPLSRHPNLIPRGEAFVKKWGVLGIFIGRFFGPLRAAVPLVAGIFEMPYWRFQIANFSSAFVWAAVLLTLGDGVSTVVRWVW